MGERLQLPVAMWRVQFQLLGGGRRHLSVVGICGALLVAGSYVIVRMFASVPLATTAGRLLGFLTAVQVLVVLLGGCNALYRSMLRDYETKMIESHRLAPMSSVSVILGYLFGATLQISTLFLLFALFGAFLSLIAGLPVWEWVVGNLVLLCAALAVWTMVVFGGMRLEKPFNPVPVVVAVSALSVPISFVPGLALVCHVYTGMIAVSLMTATATISLWTAVIPALVSLLLAVFWVSAAAVKYRRPDLPALNALRGLVLLVLAVLIGTGGILAVDAIGSSMMRGLDSRYVAQTQWITTMLGAILLASTVTCSAVKCRLLVARGAAARDWADRASDLAVATLAVLVICIIMATVGLPIWRDISVGTPAQRTTESMMGALAWAWTCTALACLIAVLSVRSVFELLDGSVKGVTVVVGLLILLLWALPPLADLLRAEFFREPSRAVEYSWLMGCSPAGTIIVTWGVKGVARLPGLLAQLALLGLLMWCVRRRRAGSTGVR